MRTVLGKLAVFKGGSAFPRDEQGASVGAFPFMKVSDLGRGSGAWTVADAANWISDEQHDRLRPTVAPEDAIVFAKIGEGLRAERLRLLTRPSAIDNNMMVAIPRDGVVPEYLYYLLKTVHLGHHAVGSALPYLKQSTLAAIDVDAHERDEQRAIAEVLGALDDKIAANRRSLEQAGLLLEAKATQASRGGVTRTLAELCDLVSRGVAPKYAETDGLLVLNQKCIRGGRVSLGSARWTAPLSGRRLEKVLKIGDSLVNSTGQGTLGRVAQWSRDVRATVDSHVSIVRWNPDLADPFLAGSLLLQRERDVEALAEGSTGQTELKRDHLGALELKLPGIDVQRRVGRDIKELVEFQNQLDDENESLAKTRDGLLPLLMSGKLRVKDAEKHIGEVV